MESVAEFSLRNEQNFVANLKVFVFKNYSVEVYK